MRVTIHLLPAQNSYLDETREVLDTVTTTGQLFANFAQGDLQRWSQLEGLSVTHSDFGMGTIVKVKQRKKYIPSIEIRFVDDESSTVFNSKSFEAGQFVAIEVPSLLQTSFDEWLAQRENERALEELAKRYNVPVEKVVTPQGSTALAAILLKIDQGERLDEKQVNALESGDCPNVVATYAYRQFRESADPWQLVKACKFLRIAKLFQKVVQIYLRHKDELVEDRRAYSALLTSVGGAYRDLGDVPSAKECAGRAIALSPNSYHPHNLMGALCYVEGDFEAGDQHFQKAVELGSSVRARDIEIKKILKNATPENRQAILKAQDSRSDEWV